MLEIRFQLDITYPSIQQINGTGILSSYPPKTSYLLLFNINFTTHNTEQSYLALVLFEISATGSPPPPCPVEYATVHDWYRCTSLATYDSAVGSSFLLCALMSTIQAIWFIRLPSLPSVPIWGVVSSATAFLFPSCRVCLSDAVDYVPLSLLVGFSAPPRLLFPSSFVFHFR